MQRSGARSHARFTEVIQQPEARRLQHFISGNACISGHHAPSHEKGHSAFHYFTDHPKSKQWDTLEALKTPSNYTDILQPSCAAESSPSIQERHCPLSSNTWSVFLFHCSGYHHIPPWSRKKRKTVTTTGFCSPSPLLTPF